MSRTYLPLGAATILAVLVVAGCGDDGSTLQARADPQEAIEGTWYPLQIDGYAVSDQGAATFADAYLQFDADGDWSGSDGCNGLGGSYEISADGSFSAQAGPQTEIGCANVPTAGLLVQAQQVGIDGQTLTLTGPERTGRYTRTQNPAPTGSPTSGSSMGTGQPVPTGSGDGSGSGDAGGSGESGGGVTGSGEPGTGGVDPDAAVSSVAKLTEPTVPPMR